MQDRLAMRNPYDWISPVRSRDHFAGRSEEISMVMEELLKLENGNSISPIVAIIGERRVGKTSLLHRIDENCISQSLISIIINVDDRMANDIWEFWKQIYYYLFTVTQDVGIEVVSDSKTSFGFHIEKNTRTDNSNTLILDNLKFVSVYETHLSSLHSPTLPYQIIKSDLNEFKEIFKKVGYKGIVFILDEAHNLKESKDVKQYLRNIIQQSPGLGIIFAGEISLGRLFTDTFEPFFGQANVIKLDNFINFDDIMKCALLPLSEEEIKLMNPMTINYLAKLSRGKPNQIRLICCSIYKRYMHGLQDDLNITIDVLDDVLDNITNAYSDSEFRDRDRDLVKTIKKLDSVNLELLYNITRYPNWQIDEIIKLDESFRGELKSNSAIERRRRMLEEKKAYFTEIGLMEENENLFQISGGEFLSLYLRFYYEIQKYGELSRKLILGKGPPTLFGEITEKLVRSLAYNFGQDLELQRLIFHHYDRDFGSIIETVKRRFEILKEFRKGIKPQCDDINELISECISVCELIDKESDYFLLCLSVRNRDNPRELIQVELYFDIHDKYLVDYSNDLRSVFNLLCSVSTYYTELFSESFTRL